MLNLAPWYYRNLLVPNEFINSPEYYELTFLDNKKHYEANVFLKSHLRPSWVSNSNLYKNSDGTGTSTYKNIAVYKAISEALERLAFYELAESINEKEYCFDLNPTTTGMAAYPHWLTVYARNNAIVEAVERWCIHEFNRGKIPSIKIPNLINNLNHYELITPIKNVKVSLLRYKHNDFYTYAFAGGRSLTISFDKALVELQRNIKVLEKYYMNDAVDVDLISATDKTLYFFSTNEGFQLFQQLLEGASNKIINSNPRVLCDKELIGEWSEYTKVWRYLLEDSYFDCASDHTFFMF